MSNLRNDPREEGSAGQSMLLTSLTPHTQHEGLSAESHSSHNVECWAQLQSVCASKRRLLNTLKGKQRPEAEARGSATKDAPLEERLGDQVLAELSPVLNKGSIEEPANAWMLICCSTSKQKICSIICTAFNMLKTPVYRKTHTAVAHQIYCQPIHRGQQINCGSSR